jgi:DEAD/DEAH box helicase domain-containing protein
MDITEFLTKEKWEITHTEQMPSREARLVSFDDLSLCSASKIFLNKNFPKGIYEHQKLAIQKVLNSANVCLTTGTASGKSLAFYVAGIELLSKSPESKIIAIYPLRALGKEQEERWAKALDDAELDTTVGRVDGQVPMQARTEILRRSRVLVLTPDVMHAWMFSQLSTRQVRDFLRQLGIIVIDEVHSYTGVFGSNSAFLFRRFRHILKLLNADPLFICASATIADSRGHLAKLFGIDFDIIDQSHDSSPRQPIQIDLVRAPLSRDFLTEISHLLSSLAKEKDLRFIVFVDSRKQTELIASIISREKDDSLSVESQSQEEHTFTWDHLKQLNILPYRAGYEEHDRSIIQDRLSKGSLTGVVSTSALELGIDIPHLTAGILVGVPYSATGFYQRIGRIGRHAPGHIIIISRGNVYDEALFSNPQALLKRPLAEGALYLENQRIQYIHTLCVARHGGEHDQVLNSENLNGKEEFISDISWPEGFLELCAKERIGEISPELQAMKGEAGDAPNHVFPLRDVEVQFKVQERLMGQFRDLGQLSYSQLMREAYPGAVYYYIAMAYRVNKINTRSREVQVRNEKKYTTSPIELPTMIFPNLTPSSIYQAKSYGKLTCIECNLQVREALSGYSERRGPNKITVAYPTDSKVTGVFFDQQRFSRNYFTTGVILTHPTLNKSRVETELICTALFEAFLMIVPFERRDVNFAVDKHRVARNQFDIEKDLKFITIYDQTYGSLRLTSRLMLDNILRSTISIGMEICALGETTNAKKEAIKALESLLAETQNSPIDHAIHAEEERRPGQNLIKILLPDSKGLAINNGNKEFQVEGVFFDPKNQRLSYRGKYVDQQHPNETTIVILPVEGLIEVPGDSVLGYYDLETGKVTTL